VAGKNVSARIRNDHGFPSELLDDAVAWRRRLHRHPELAYQEHETADFVASCLQRFGLSVHRGLAGTGVVGTLSRGRGGRTIGIRADMDALPIQEESGVEHTSSVAGVMHACGHDGHTAVLLGAARVCADLPNLNGTVHFIFQPAEENEGGGKRMVEEGLFELFPCEAVYSLHNRPSLPLGSCIALDGPLRAAFAVFEIDLAGKGCHGAHPHDGTDVLLAASHIHVALQSIVSRATDPQKAAVLSVTQIQGGSTWNVIPGTCSLRGTARWFDREIGDLLERRLEEIVTSVAAAFGCVARVTYERRIPATINDPTAAATLRRIAQSPGLNLEVIDAAPVMGSDDFAFMLQACRGAYLLLGSGRGPEDASLHSPRFDFNDELLPLAMRFWVTLVEDALKAR
jgi:amidohydrolase